MRLVLTALAMLFASATVAGAIELPKDIRVGAGTLTVSKQDMMCLALNDYWEARGETLRGRVAVAQVVLNRSQDPRFPGTICDVVKENRTGGKKGCQFSWYCDGKADKPLEEEAWRSSVLLAMSVLRRDNAVKDPTDGALWYHSTRVHPAWANRLERTISIGTHVFYSDDDALRPSTMTAKRVDTTKTGTTEAPATETADSSMDGDLVVGQ
jgi:spore germination cell wall hydrolase CwlJ-like protein